MGLEERGRLLEGFGGRDEGGVVGRRGSARWEVISTLRLETDWEMRGTQRSANYIYSASISTLSSTNPTCSVSKAYKKIAERPSSFR